MNIILVGLGGFVGAVFRYLLSFFYNSIVTNNSFPAGTLIINIIGCFLIGLLSGISENHQLLSHNVRLFLLVGLLGGFTTFSTFGYESFHLIKSGIFLNALFNISLHIVLGIIAVWCGFLFSTIKG